MLCDCFVGNAIAISVGVVTILLTYFKWTYQYWERKKVPYIKPTIPWGNGSNPFKRKLHSAIEAARIYEQLKAKGWKHGGVFSVLTCAYMVVDLDYLKNILTKDFDHFVDRGLYCNEDADPLSAHLFAIGGEKWRNLRAKVAPTFTSEKMKMMFQTLVDCVPNFLSKIEVDRVANVSIDIKEILECFTTNIIGTCAFGLEFSTFKGEDSLFRKYSRKFFERNILRLLKIIFAIKSPNIAKKLGVTVIPTDIANFFIKLVKDTVNYREKNNYSRKDFMQLLIDIKGNKLATGADKYDDKTLTLDEIAAQSFSFFVAGFETSNATMTFALYELAKHQDIQDKLREEINSILAKHNGEITYEAIQDMKYMDQVINESLRKYPPVALITRKCVKDYKVPGQDVMIEKGTMVFVPVFGIHHDKEFYPDPEKFDPDRFTEENKSKRHRYAHIPFGEGPRNCIGMQK